MTRDDVLLLARTALAVAVETRAGQRDPAVLDDLLDQLDDLDMYAFVALLRTYHAHFDRLGIGALRHAGLALARRECGLDP